MSLKRRFSNTASVMNDPEDLDLFNLKSFIGWPDSEMASEIPKSGSKKFQKPYCSASATLKLPKSSPFHIYAAEKEEEYASLANQIFVTKSESWTIGGPAPKFEERLSLDNWVDILDHVQSPVDLYSLAQTSRTLYNLALPRLYSVASVVPIRSPFLTHENKKSHKLIPINFFFEPITPTATPLVATNIDNDISEPEKLPLAKRCKLVGDNSDGTENRLHNTNNSEPSSSMAMYQGTYMLRYIKSIAIEKWEGLRVILSSDPSCPFEVEFNVCEDEEYKPHGVKDIMWRRKGELSFTSLSETLVDLLKRLPLLEKFSFNPQRYNTFYSNGADISRLQKVDMCYILSLHPAQGIMPLVLSTLKGMRNLKSLTVNFQDWDPFHLDHENNAHFERSSYETHVPHLHGLVGFTNLEELVILGIVSEDRFFELGILVHDLMSQKNIRGGLKRVEVRFDNSWWEKYLQDEDPTNPTNKIMEGVDYMWEECFPHDSNTPRAKICRAELTGIFQFGPTKWQFEYAKMAELNVFRTETLTAIDLQGLSKEQVLQTLESLVDLGGTESLKVFVVECKIMHLGEFLKHFRGLRELYVFDPDKADIPLTGCKDLSPTNSGAFEPGPVEIGKVHGVFDIISEHHLPTLEVLALEEQVVTPQSNCTGETINSIGGWGRRAGKLRELAVNVYGPWEGTSQFLSAFKNLKALHLFNHRCNNPAKKFPTFEATSFNIHCKNLCNAQTAAVRIANLWGRDFISDKGDVGPPIPGEDRWIWVGDCNRPWKWNTHDVAKYAGWRNFESQLWFKFFGGSRADQRVWEKEAKMAKVLRQHGILIHPNERGAKWGGCCAGCHLQLDVADPDEDSEAFDEFEEYR